MIITVVGGKIIVYCNGVINVLCSNDHDSLCGYDIEEALHNTGAPVRTVYDEIRCNGAHVMLSNNLLVIRGVSTYTVSYSILSSNYLFPNRIIACYNGLCWTCTSEYNLHTMKLDYEWFNHIASRRKIIEGRLYDEKRRKIKVGDCILFKSYNDGLERFLYTVVVGLRYYRSFKEMLSIEGIEKVLPGVSSINEGVNIYYNYYTPLEEQKYGVLAIELDLL